MIALDALRAVLARQFGLEAEMPAVARVLASRARQGYTSCTPAKGGSVQVTTCA